MRIENPNIRQQLCCKLHKACIVLVIFKPHTYDVPVVTFISQLCGDFTIRCFVFGVFVCPLLCTLAVGQDLYWTLLCVVFLLTLPHHSIFLEDIK